MFVCVVCVCEGNRDVVGFGVNGVPDYFDREDIPCPGVRWAANTNEVVLLHEKAHGDWRKLSLEQKKARTPHSAYSLHSVHSHYACFPTPLNARLFERRTIFHSHGFHFLCSVQSEFSADVRRDGRADRYLEAHTVHRALDLGGRPLLSSLSPSLWYVFHHSSSMSSILDISNGIISPIFSLNLFLGIFNLRRVVTRVMLLVDVSVVVLWLCDVCCA